jgi:hypothetical protein
VPAFGLNAWYGKDVAGQDFSIKDPKRLAGLIAPLTYMNAIGAYQQDGLKGVGYTLPLDIIVHCVHLTKINSKLAILNCNCAKYSFLRKQKILFSSSLNFASSASN